MKRRMKRIVCSVLVATMILSIILPILPEGLFEVHADTVPSVNDIEHLYVFSDRLTNRPLKTQADGFTNITEYEFEDGDVMASNIRLFDLETSDPYQDFVRVMKSVDINGDDNGFAFEK